VEKLKTIREFAGRGFKPGEKKGEQKYVDGEYAKKDKMITGKHSGATRSWGRLGSYN